MFYKPVDNDASIDSATFNALSSGDSFITYNSSSKEVGYSTNISEDSTKLTIAKPITYSTRAYLHVYNNGTQSVDNATDTLLTLNTTIDTLGSGYTWSSNRFTNTSGITKYYTVRVNLRSNGESSITYYPQLYINGSSTYYKTSTNHARNASSYIVKLNNSEYLEVYINHIAGSTITFGASGNITDSTRMILSELA